MGAANSTFDQRQAELAAGFESRDVQLREQVDRTSRTNNDSHETLQRALSEHLSAKKQEVDQRMASAMSDLSSEARRL